MNTIGKGWESDAPEGENARASRKYPSVAVNVPGGLSIHVYCDDDGLWWVWINACNDFSGTCVGSGQTRDSAVADAVRELEAAVERLQGPAW